MDSQTFLLGSLIVIPAYNEAQNLKSVLSELQGALTNASTLVVDDGFIDGTSDIVAEESALPGQQED